MAPDNLESIDTEEPGGPRTLQSIDGLWPFWTRVYAQGDPLPDLSCTIARPQYSFDEGDELPEEYRALLMKMLRHEGERAGNKSFLGLMGTCLEIAETHAPDADAKLIKSEY